MRNGFTLVELLVAISLIGVLSIAGFASYTNTQRVARNSRRTADLKAIQGSLESYFGSVGSYPNPGCDPGTTYLPQGIPKDPKSNSAYAPTSCTASTYCFCSLLEGGASGNATNASCAYGSGSYFCVNQLQ